MDEQNFLLSIINKSTSGDHKGQFFFEPPLYFLHIFVVQMDVGQFTLVEGFNDWF